MMRGGKWLGIVAAREGGTKLEPARDVGGSAPLLARLAPAILSLDKSPGAV